MLVLSFLFCIFSFLGSYVFGHKIGSRGSAFFCCANIAFSVLLSLYGLWLSLRGQLVSVVFCRWVELGQCEVSWSFLFDPLCNTTVFVVTLVSFFIHCYSVSYMWGDPHFPRFLSFLSLFTAFMVLLVSAGNFLQFFLAWEGVGVCSYLLISFWYTRAVAVKSALEAIAFNRVGDFGLLVAVIGFSIVFHTLDFLVVFSLSPGLAGFQFRFFDCYEVPVLDCLGVLMLLGVVAKSAQLGLHVWLPDAMEGPTPVSALLHSSTMVVAGVFLLLRCSPIFEFSPLVLMLVTLIGSLTAFFAASVGLVQYDLKKVIAYSTCSQLGYMVFICGVSGYNLSFYHLFNHAFFKSLLFLAAGSIIHALGDEQDMRRMGGLISVLPFTYSVTLVGSLSLSGFPFLSGFYSKDAILEGCWGVYSSLSWFSGSLGLMAAVLTSFYSFRLLYLVFWSEPRLCFTGFGRVHEAPFLMSAPLFFLSLFSLFSGYFFRDMFIGLGTDYWVNSFFVLPSGWAWFSEFLPFWFKLLPVVGSLTGFGAAYVFYFFVFPRSSVLVLDSAFFRYFYSFFSRRWYFDYIWFSLSFWFLRFAYSATFRALDQGWLVFFGPGGFVKFFTYCSYALYKVQSGFIFHYVYLVFLCFLVLLVFFYLPHGFLQILFLWVFFAFRFFVVLKARRRRLPQYRNTINMPY